MVSLCLSKGIIKIYFIWSSFCLVQALSYLYLKFEFHSRDKGGEIYRGCPLRWLRHCISVSKNNVKFSLGSLYRRHYILGLPGRPNTTKDNLISMNQVKLFSYLEQRNKPSISPRKNINIIYLVKII